MSRMEGYSKSRLTGSYLTLVISVSLVLFLLGILGLVIINARELSDYFRESLSFSIMLDDEAREADIRMLQKDLDAKHYVKSTSYVSKDEAAAKMKEDLERILLIFWATIRYRHPLTYILLLNTPVRTVLRRSKNM